VSRKAFSPRSTPFPRKALFPDPLELLFFTNLDFYLLPTANGGHRQFFSLSMTESFILAQGNAGGSPIIMMVLMIIIFYFLLIRPQQKQRKEQEARIAALKKGDKVITAGGIHASVHHISEKTVTLKLSEGVLIKFEKTSIQTVVKKSKSSSNNEETPVIEADEVKK